MRSGNCNRYKQFHVDNYRHKGRISKYIAFEPREVAHINIRYSHLTSIIYCLHQRIDLIFPGNSLHSQEFLDACTSIEAAETAHLGAAVGEIGLVVHGHIVDVDGTVDLR